MRAKTINFERGVEPKKAMGTGDVYGLSKYKLEIIKKQLDAEWKAVNIDVDITQHVEGEDCENYGYDEYLMFDTYNFSSEDEKLDEKIQQLGLEIFADEHGDIFGQWWYDASPIFSGDARTLNPDPQPWPVANAKEVIEEISDEEEETDEDYNYETDPNAHFMAGRGYTWDKKQNIWVK